MNNQSYQQKKNQEENDLPGKENLNHSLNQVNSNKNRISTLQKASVKQISTQKLTTKKQSNIQKKLSSIFLKKWFYNLSIGQKQFMIAGASFVSILGLIGVGSLTSSKSLQSQLVKQAESGYSAVYVRNSTGKFTLVTSVNQGKEISEKTPKNIALSDTSLLTKALDAQGKPVTEKIKIEGQNHTITALAIPNISQAEANSVLVRGTPETKIQALLLDSLLAQLGLGILVLGLNLGLAVSIAKAITKPLKELKQTAKKFSSGDRKIRAEVFSSDEVGELATTFNALIEQQIAQEEKQQIFDKIARTRQIEALEFPFNQLLQEVRAHLNADRVVIYRFHPDWSGYIAGEAVIPGFPIALRNQIEDACIPEELLEAYRKGRVFFTSNVFEASFHKDHQQLMNRLQIKSNLVIPIGQGEDLFGLLVAHHCAEFHDWKQSEIDYLKQFADQIGQALGALSSLERKQYEAEKEREQKEALQQELLELLTNVEGASSGNLTVRAEITDGQIGIVADFFNSIIESMRDIVTQVKQSTSQVNLSLEKDEGAMNKLADESAKQTQKVQQMLEFVKQMSMSIQEVTNNASRAAKVARTASRTAKTGGVAIDRTVQSIVQLRDTVGETAKKVKRLGESSQQISKVISLINKIALQTNLLAVNASIEAARAGEEGRGFAVVAEEVGELAVQSATATKEIEQIVENIQLETSEVVKAMERGTTQVVKGTRLVGEAKKSFGQIATVSRQIDRLLQSISGETVSQTQTSAMVNDLMKDIAKVSERTSDFSRQVSSSLQETIVFAQQLQESVGTFRVD